MELRSLRFLYFLVVLGMTIITRVTADGICGDSRKGPYLTPDPDDCASFFICHNRMSIRLSCDGSTAGASKVFDPTSGNCVPKGSTHDRSKCNKLPTKQVQKCQAGSYETFANDNNCAKYYQCTGITRPLSMECPYPRLYDVTSGKCLIYLVVKCGSRREPKDPCEYEANQCEGSGCVPCRARFGTCISKPNGPNAWDEKPWTPHFLICKDERVILQGDCRDGKHISIFNPFSRLCTPMSELMQLTNYIKV